MTNIHEIAYTHDNDSLRAMTIMEITKLYNKFAEELCANPVKKFRDKQTAILRVLKIQAEYREELAEQKEQQVQDELTKDDKEATIADAELAAEMEAEEVTESDKCDPLDEAIKTIESRIRVHEKKSRARKNKLSLDTILAIVTGNPREGTLEHDVFAAIDKENGSTVSDILSYVMVHHKRPSTGLSPDEIYVLMKLRWFIKKGSLTKLT